MHNLAFQVCFPLASIPARPSWRQPYPEGLEFYGKILVLKKPASAIAIVLQREPTYAREILTAELVAGSKGCSTSRERSRFGILQWGQITGIWDPATEPISPQLQFCKTSPASGYARRRCKRNSVLKWMRRLRSCSCEQDHGTEDGGCVAVALPRIIESGANARWSGRDCLLEERFEQPRATTRGRSGPHRYGKPLAPQGFWRPGHLASSGPFRAVRAHAALCDGTAPCPC